PEIFGKGHIEIDAAGIAEEVAASVAVSETGGSDEAVGIADEGADDPAGEADSGLGSGEGKVGGRVRRRTGSDAGIIGAGDAAGAATIDNAERRAGGEEGDTGNFPIFPKLFLPVGEAGAGNGVGGIVVGPAGKFFEPFVEGEFEDVAEVEEMTLVEVGAGT